MASRTIFLILAVLLASGAMAQAYRWVDADGVVHFSDRPQEGAEQIELPEPNTVSVTRPARRGSATPPGDDDTSDESTSEQVVNYTSLEIRNPGAEETLWNIEGVLNVSLDLQPALQPGHRVRVKFDGNSQVVSGTSFQLQEVWRGEHSLQAEILDESGKMLIRSRLNRFYVQQNTIIP